MEKQGVRRNVGQAAARSARKPTAAELEATSY